MMPKDAEDDRRAQKEFGAMMTLLRTASEDSWVNVQKVSEALGLHIDPVHILGLYEESTRPRSAPVRTGRGTKASPDADTGPTSSFGLSRGFRSEDIIATMKSLMALWRTSDGKSVIRARSGAVYMRPHFLRNVVRRVFLDPKAPAVFKHRFMRYVGAMETVLAKIHSKSKSKSTPKAPTPEAPTPTKHQAPPVLTPSILQAALASQVGTQAQKQPQTEFRVASPYGPTPPSTPQAKLSVSWNASPKRGREWDAKGGDWARQKKIPRKLSVEGPEPVV